MLSDSKFLEYSNLSDKLHLREAIGEILIPRIVGSGNHSIVRQYIVQSLRDLEWDVEVDSFHDHAPIKGKLHFHNIIARLNPNAERFLVLACHYDSKYMPGVEFLGATDSAVPCAMLLNLAYVLQQQLESLKEQTQPDAVVLRWRGGLQGMGTQGFHLRRPTPSQAVA